ncbi:hypothetical protein LA080_009685 [Diaporthe eres]|nr:hypothetical protein LA080_009685 [Diaporthe eres]
MSDSGERDADPHSLFQISQNENLDEEERDQAEQRLRELGGGKVYVPPPTVLVTPSKKRARDDGTSEDESESQPANNNRKKRKVDDNGSKKPVVIPPNVEVIVISSDSETESNSTTFNTRRQREQRKRLYHPENHTSTCWRCPVGTCRRHSLEFGFQNNAHVERYIRNRHADEFVYPCISGCSIAFRNGRTWEQHHIIFHADEIG